MNGRRLTKIGLSIAAIALAIVEAEALLNNEEGDTISARIHDVVVDYPVVAGLMAAPLVHFCTPTRDNKKPLPIWQGTAVALLGGALMGLAWPRYDRSRP